MKKGFTLIELLAVILILGIIALIAIPTVNNILEEARMGAFRTSVNQVAKSAEENCQLQQIKNQEITNKIIFTDGTPSINLEYKGTGPDRGQMNVSNDCGVTFAVADTRYCAIRENATDEIKVGKLENGVCKINGTEYALEIKEYTPEECFNFDESTGTIIEYLCGRRYNYDTSSYETNTLYYPDVVVPETIRGVTVEHIGESAFTTLYIDDPKFTQTSLFSEINSIDLPNTLKSIGNSAFYDNNLTYFKLPQSLEFIDIDAFYTINTITIELGDLAKDLTIENYPGLYNALSSCNSSATNTWKVKYNKLDNKYENFILSTPNYTTSNFTVENFSNYKLYTIVNTEINC